ncbi:TlpA family protein disulfide reductase [Olivibacter sitiensis]|uniref:TlpA family protein disulfide reductase n=1 Tax=Olivibacter sitiensis TaxID=376470 RepID=UPI0003F58B17|nr:TlpA disulfide reductase family protein [Olivibacter sitiensis]
MKQVLGFMMLAFLTSAYIDRPSKAVHLSTLDELETRLSQGGDTIFVVNFWATWCGPCVKEMPYFEQLVSDKSANLSPIKLLFVSLDSPKKPQVVEKFVADKKIRNEVLILNETDQQEYIDRISEEWSGAIPATLLVQKSKNKRKFHEQEFTLEQLEQSLLAFQTQSQ